MNYIGKIVSNVKDIYQQINPTTLSGAIDIITIQQEDNTILCSPFYVKFGKIDVLRAYKKTVDIFINDILVDVQMQLGDNGEAYFAHLEGPCNCSTCMKNLTSNSKLKIPMDPYRNLSVSDSENLNETCKTKISLCSDAEIENRKCENVLNMTYSNAPFVLPSKNVIGNCDNSNELQSPPTISVDSSFIEAGTSSDSYPTSSSPSFSKSSKFEDSYSSFKKNTQAFGSVFKDLDVSLSLCNSLKSSISKPDTFDSNIVKFDQFVNNPCLLNNPQLVVRINNVYYNWAVAAPIIMSYVCFHTYLPKEIVGSLKKLYMKKQKKGWFPWRRADEKSTEDEVDDPLEQMINQRHITEIKQEAAYSDPGTPNNDENIGEFKKTNDNEKSPLFKGFLGKVSLENTLFPIGEDCLHKAKTLSSNDLISLNLKPGENSIKFSITTRYRGTVECSAKIFLWKYTDKIIISDVDGTITRSDVLGMMLPLVGKDWTQDGVTKLYSLINVNGYKMLYLSARNIGIANHTRIYLQNIIRDTLALPSGPILLSPSSLFESFHREVIEKRPEVFKIPCLKIIKNLFPPDYSPFFAGFGNRSNDYVSYLAVGVHPSKIYIINFKGQIKHESSPSYLTSYSNMAEFVDYMFPMLTEEDANNVNKDQYNDFFFWRRRGI